MKKNSGKKKPFCGVMKIVFCILKKVPRIFCITTGVLFVVYFWNLDQKLVAKLYILVNKIFDRKKEDRQF